METQIGKAIIPDFRENYKNIPKVIMEFPRKEIKDIKNCKKSSSSSNTFKERFNDDYISTMQNPEHFYEYKKRMKSRLPKPGLVENSFIQNVQNLKQHQNKNIASKDSSFRIAKISANVQNQIHNKNEEVNISKNNKNRLNKSLVGLI